MPGLAGVWPRVGLRPTEGHSARADEGTLEAQVLPGLQETRGAGILQFKIDHRDTTAQRQVPFAEMN